MPARILAAPPVAVYTQAFPRNIGETPVIVICWNIQRPGESGVAGERLEGVLAYLSALTETYAPDFVCLCECPPRLIDELNRRLAESRDYAGVWYIHRQEIRAEFAEAVGFGKLTSPTTFFSEASCSFYVLYRRAIGLVRIEVTEECRFFYPSREDIIGKSGTLEKVEVSMEARPLVLIRAGVDRSTFGLVHLISGVPGLATRQLAGYLGYLRSQGGAFLIGDMNIDLKSGAQLSCEGFTTHAPGYVTHPGSGTTLDYLWTNGTWRDVRAAQPPKGMVDNYFAGDGGLSDHAPVIYRLDNRGMFGAKLDALAPLPYPPRRVTTRHGTPTVQTLWQATSSSSAPSKEMVQPSIASFIKVSYTLSAAQQLALTTANRDEVPVAPDGDCLFAALLAMGVQASDGTTFTTVAGLRRHVADGIRNTDALRLRLLFIGVDPATIATQIETPRAWVGLAGDVTPELIAEVLGIRLNILNPDGSSTNVGLAGTVYTLIRFTPFGGEHYHATRPRT